MFVQCCFTSTQTVRTIRDGEPRTSISPFTQLLTSEKTGEVAEILAEKWPRFLSQSMNSRGWHVFHTDRGEHQAGFHRGSNPGSPGSCFCCCFVSFLSTPTAGFVCEPVWPSSKALLRLVSRGTSVQIRFGSSFSSKVVVCSHCLVTLSLTIYETLKRLSSLPTLMQEPFWW